MASNTWKNLEKCIRDYLEKQVDPIVSDIARVISWSFKGQFPDLPRGYINKEYTYFRIMQQAKLVEEKPNNKGHYKISSKGEEFFKTYYRL